MVGEKYRDEEVKTIFFGGGTPSIIPAPQMEELLKALTSSFRIKPDAEFTSEANPGTLREDWLTVMRKYGLNRISLGVQSANDELLTKIGRIHSFADAKNAVQLSRACGIKNLNVDMMFALPSQTIEDYYQSIQAICALSPEHISAYSLILEEGTALYDQVNQGKVTLPSEDEAADMYVQGIKWLAEHGYHQYEVSNFAKSGFECKHNIGYWQDENYLGLGVAAHSMLRASKEQTKQGVKRIRKANTEDIVKYMTMLDDDLLPMDEELLISSEEAMFETMMLGLRMTEGVDRQRFESLHGCQMTSVYEPELSGLIKDGLAMWDGNQFTLTSRGLALQNDVLLRLMKD